MRTVDAFSTKVHVVADMIPRFEGVPLMPLCADIITLVQDTGTPRASASIRQPDDAEREKRRPRQRAASAPMPGGKMARCALRRAPGRCSRVFFTRRCAPRVRSRLCAFFAPPLRTEGRRYSARSMAIFGLDEAADIVTVIGQSSSSLAHRPMPSGRAFAV